MIKTTDGKEKTTNDIIEAIDEETKSVTFKFVEGDLMELYKTFIVVVHVDTKEENTSVTWNFHYEKLKEDVEEPNTLMDLCIEITKDIETHHPKWYNGDINAIIWLSWYGVVVVWSVCTS